MRTILLLPFLVLTGCATTDIPPPPSETKIPVGVSCLTRDQVPAKPVFVTDAQLAVKPSAQLVLSLAGDRLERQEYEGKLEATIKGCVSEQPIPDGITVPVTPSDKPWWKFW
ncbi:MAG: hypothetical protein Q7J73_02760 [Dehalococcoidales bacterium]|nr:hypothetical protein [Dehalococcoidales bacterium]